MNDSEHNLEAQGDDIALGHEPVAHNGRGDGGAEIHTALISGETFGVRAVQYAVIDGWAIFEGDIILGTDEELQRATTALREERSRRARSALSEAQPGDTVDPGGEAVSFAITVSGQGKRWPGGVVPFEIDQSLTTAARSAVQQAIAHWHDTTRLAFRQRQQGDAQWLVFRDANECSSWVGRQGGAQDVNIAANCGRGATIHEIGHAVGLWHEQSREDRDLFVSILWQNIQNGQAHNFDQHISDGDDIGPYDYGSIMHYGTTDFGTVNPATGATNPTIVPLQAPPAGVAIGQRGGLSVGDRGAVAWMYASIYPSEGNTWRGRFRGQPGEELLYYSRARRHWFLGASQGATLAWTDVGDTSGFGDLADGRPIWSGDFTGDGRSDVLFYSPGDDNWWLGELIVEDAQCQPLRIQLDAKQQQVRTLQASKAGLNPRDPQDLREIREINRQIDAVRQDIRALEGQSAALRCPPQRPQNASGQAIVWSMVGNTIGFGHAINDGRPFWIGDFNGDGRSDVLFYYPGDDTWWLGTLVAGQLQWNAISNTAGFGHAINDGRPFWTGRFSRPDLDEVLFYYPGDDTWWLGTLVAGQLQWNAISNTAGFGHAINDGRPFWIGDFNGDGRSDVLFYYPGDDTWWLGTLAGGQLQWNAISNTAGFGHNIWDGRPFWTGRFSRPDLDEVLFYYPGDDTWWLGTLVGGQLQWNAVSNTIGFGHAINDGRPFWIGDFNGDGRSDVLFHYRGDLRWWQGSMSGNALSWTLRGTW